MEATHQAMGAKLQKICRDHLFSTTEENWLTIRTTMTITIIRTVNDKQTTMQILFWKWNRKNKKNIYKNTLIFVKLQRWINFLKMNIVISRNNKQKRKQTLL